MAQSNNVRYDFEPYSGTPGEEWTVFEEQLLNAGAAISDDRGWSLADHFLGTDELGPAGPPLPGNAAGAAAAQNAFRKRQKQAYGMLAKHVLDRDLVTQMRNGTFQDGCASFVALRASCQVPINHLRLRDMDMEWNAITILNDVGVYPHSIQTVCKKLRTLNGKRPAHARKTPTQMGDRLLECIFTTSKHFSESALLEYNLPQGQRQFELVAPHPQAGHRDFNAIEAYFHPLWHAAVTSRLPGFHQRAPAQRHVTPVHHSVESGLFASDGASHSERAALAMDNAFVPRSGSPTHSLTLLADCGDVAADRRGTVTTTDWGILLPNECAAAANEGGIDQEFEAAYVVDSDDALSIELICDCCRGLGHVRRVCPSNRNRYRSIDYAIGVLTAKQQKLKSTPPRRPPGRGQRGPFRQQQRRQPTRASPFGTPVKGAARARLADDSSDDSPPHDAVPRRPLFEDPADELITERGTAAAEQRNMLTDDELFAAESDEFARAAADVLAPGGDVATPRYVRPVHAFVAAFFTLAACIILRAGDIAKAIGVGAVTVLAITAAMPAIRGLQLAPQPHREAAYPARAVGYAPRVAPFDVCVDSGATSTVLPEHLSHLLHTVTDANPKRKLFIANDVGLDILRIGHVNIPTRGYTIDGNLNKGPMQDVTVPCSRALVVRGAGSTILLSTRVLSLDNVNTYLNDDNSIRTADCLLIKDTGVVVPLDTSGGGYHTKASFDTALKVAGAAAPTVERSAAHPSVRPASHIHRALGHCGHQRAAASNLVIDGVPVRAATHDAASCRGCRLGNTGKSRTQHRRSTAAHGGSTAGFLHFGQQVDTDVCSGFVPSFPHGFRYMINFCDRYTHETFLYFLVNADAHEVGSALLRFASSVAPRLPRGKIGRWVTDNGLCFLSEEVDNLAHALAHRRGFQVPNDSDTLPVPERHWGVLQRIMRSDLAHAEAPRCLWPWAANQANLLLYYLPTSALKPPTSPYAFASGNDSPVDISWAHTMFCDVTVAIPTRDRDGKLGNRSADGVHLGYDARRGAHFVYVPSLTRISTFTVSDWREDSFKLCKSITADTPVNYAQLSDLAVAPVTSAMLPRMHIPRGFAAAERVLHVLLLCSGPSTPNNLATVLRERGHTVTCFDTAICSSHDLTEPALQRRVLALATRVHFVFMSPPCLTASIAYDPPVRTVRCPRGVADLDAETQLRVDTANALYQFCAKIATVCLSHDVGFAIESAASRRHGPGKCPWPRFANHGFLWDFPDVAALSPAYYKCFAQCAFGAPWQKYTGLLVDGCSEPSFARLFDHAQCECIAHETRLKGYDDSGVARTAVAAAYVPRLAHAFASAIVDSCHERVPDSAHVARHSLNSLTRDSMLDTMSDAHVLDLSCDVPSVDVACARHSARRVSEAGSIPVPQTLAQARKSEHWPLFRDAISTEIQGKLANKAWTVVRRPADARVHPSRYVFTVKYNLDGSVSVVKARFVACGYSQLAGVDYTAVFAATLPGVSFRVLCASIADEDLDTDHIDAVKAFTQADIDTPIYVEAPRSPDDGPLSKPPPFVILLHKALEGIKQGAYLWFAHNKKAWLQLGFTSWLNEANLYIHKPLGIRVGVFADDILVGYPRARTDEYRTIKAAYSKLIHIGSCDVSPALKFTGVQISRNRAERTLTVAQPRYIEQLALEYKGKFTERDSPYGADKAARARFDSLAPLDSGGTIERTEYLKLMGKLIWPSHMTRVDIAMPVNKLCSFAQQPTDEHFQFGLDIIGYLVATKDLGITYGGRLRVPLGLKAHPPCFLQSGGLYCAHDSSWGTHPRPMGGYVVMYNNGAVDWSATRLKIVPASSHEAEAAVAAKAAKATVFVRNLLANNNRTVTGPTPMLGDNQAHYTSVQQDGATARTRYYERCLEMFKRAVLLLILAPFLVSTNDMIADMFTKAVDTAAFTLFRNTAMNVHGTLKDRLELSYLCSAGSTRRVMRDLLRKL